MPNGFGRGYGRGYGRGFGRGYGRGYGRTAGWGYGGYGYGYGPEPDCFRGSAYDPYGSWRPDPREEEQMLMEYKAFLEEELAEVERRLKGLQDQGR
ncbi:DUF5320 family protein [Kosmotoga sp. DU53]|uniref:DUF5320 family protein n=1 Tax=Kosmotoga sp. DU53 TaxID=1310160 RepID=UPI0007C4561D|nr:DUF5320 family protein [Kosmotoga sp. DU53]OAA21362.1 hypothetical protein DU53_06170 [Kosmotoga sp. DU53]